MSPQRLVELLGEMEILQQLQPGPQHQVLQLVQQLQPTQYSRVLQLVRQLAQSQPPAEPEIVD